MTVRIILLDSLETKVNGLLKIPLDNLPLPLDFINRHPILIYLPPLQFGGNHRHPRREIFLSLSDDLELQWIDENGIKHIKKMKENNQVYLFDIPPFVPHAIVNVSKDSPAILVEWVTLPHNYIHRQIEIQAINSLLFSFKFLANCSGLSPFKLV